jgi:hypothetical protein
MAKSPSALLDLNSQTIHHPLLYRVLRGEHCGNVYVRSLDAQARQCFIPPTPIHIASSYTFCDASLVKLTEPRWSSA